MHKLCLPVYAPSTLRCILSHVQTLKKQLAYRLCGCIFRDVTPHGLITAGSSNDFPTLLELVKDYLKGWGCPQWQLVRPLPKAVFASAEDCLQRKCEKWTFSSTDFRHSDLMWLSAALADKVT